MKVSSFFIVGAIVFLVAPILFSAPRVKEIVASGNDYFSEDELKKALNIEAGEQFSSALSDTIMHRLNRLYEGEGFLDARFSDSVSFSIDSSEITVFLQISEGKQTILASVILSGVDSCDSSVVMNRLLPLFGKPYRKNELAIMLDDIISCMENRGYPFACIAVDSARFDDGRVFIFGRFSTGELVRLDFLDVRGLTRTRHWVVEKQFLFRRGELFQKEKVKRQLSRVNRKGTVYVSGYEIAVHPDGKYGLTLLVREAQTNFVLASLGFGEELFGSADLNFRNLFGTGRIFSLHWEKTGEDRTVLKLHYTEPFVLGMLSVSPRYLFEKMRGRYLKRSFGAGVGYPVSSAFEIEGGYEHSTIEYEQASAIYMNSVELLGSFDTRGASFLPKRGEGVSFSVRGSRAEKTDFLRTKLSFDGFFPLAEKNVIHNRILFDRIFSKDEIPESELIRFGGANLLRGYKQEQFEAESLLFGTLEYRLFLDRRTALVLFSDAAYSQQFFASYGAGVRLIVPFGGLGVDYAVPQEGNLLSGKVHFIYQNRF